MARSTGTFIIMVLIAAAARADDASKAAAVKQKAGEIGEAIQKEDYARVADLTYPKAIELLGGREKAIRAMEAEMKKVREHGLSLLSVKIGEPGEFLGEGENTFVVLPTTTEVTAPGGKIVVASYLLGISPDGGKGWTFLDGNGLGTAEKRERLLPKLPGKLKLPEVEKPRFIKDK